MPRDIITIRRRGGYFTAAGSGAPVITNPTQIANCVLWLDGADSGQITIVTGVSVWADKSAASSNVSQPTGSAQPAYASVLLNSKNTLTFVGGSSLDLVTTTSWPAGSDLSGGSTLFIVLRPNVGGNSTQPIVRFQSTNPTALQHENTGGASPDKLEGFVVSSGGLVTATPASIMTTAVWRMDMVVVDASGLTITLQSNQVTIGGPAAFTGTVPSAVGDIIQLGTDGSSFSTIDIAEVIIYKRVLTSGVTGEQSSVYNYLSSKWGISLGTGTP